MGVDTACVECCERNALGIDTGRWDTVTVDTDCADKVDEALADTIGVDTVGVERRGVDTTGVETSGEGTDAQVTAGGAATDDADVFKIDVGLVAAAESGERDTIHSGVAMSLETVDILINGDLPRGEITEGGALGRTGLAEMGGGREASCSATCWDGVSGRRSEVELCPAVLLPCCVLLVPGPR